MLTIFESYLSCYFGPRGCDGASFDLGVDDDTTDVSLGVSDTMGKYKTNKTT
jgi:hypothetical protein